MTKRLIRGLVIMVSCAACMPSAAQTVARDGASVAQVVSVDSLRPAFRKDSSIVKMVLDNAVSARNIVGNLSFTINMGGEDTTVPGSIHMRRDSVIRIQLFIPILGSEVGRLEFTPDYVLIVDRMHKEYVKEDYKQLSFLRDNGLDFYGLQALFWNELMPTDSLSAFDLDILGREASYFLTLKKGDMEYKWNIDRNSRRINEADITYSRATAGTTKLTWWYSDFKPLASKQFPTKQSMTLKPDAMDIRKDVSVTLDIGKLKDDSDWDTRTTVSDKYKKVDARDVFTKLLSM